MAQGTSASEHGEAKGRQGAWLPGVLAFAITAGACALGWDLFGRGETASSRQAPAKPLSAESDGASPEGHSVPPHEEAGSKDVQFGPNLVVDCVRHDFGTVCHRERKKTSIVLRNRGKHLIRFGKLESSCECLEAALKQAELGPGEEALLEVKLIAENLGSYCYTLEIPFSDPTSRKLTMRFTVEVRAPFEVEPRRLAFGKVTPEQPVTLSVTVSHYDNKPFRITAVESSRKEFVVEPREFDSSAPKHAIRVTAQPTPEVASRSRFIMATLTITTDLQNQKPLKVKMNMQLR